MVNELEQAGQTADALRADVERLFVRGLATAMPGDYKSLGARAEEWDRVGAHHIAGCLTSALRALEGGGKDASRRLLSAYTSLHGFERLASIESARIAWRACLMARAPSDDAAVEPKSPPAAKPAAAPPQAAMDEGKSAAALLKELSLLIEDLVRTGLTSATQATRDKLDAAFKEASRRKLLRLGASLRYVNEEVGRFIRDDGSFATKRYAFFLHRSWLLARGMVTALERSDAKLMGSLMSGSSSAPEPVAGLATVTLGVLKRQVAGACTFDFRLRVVGAKDERWLGASLVYSLVFARKPEVPAEAYLHLPQPQKFVPKLLCEPTIANWSEVGIIADDRGGGRLVLTPKSSVTVGASFDDWQRFVSWGPEPAALRAEQHRTTPLDLAVELQEEIVLQDFRASRAAEGGLLLGDDSLVLHVTLPGEEGKQLAKRLEAAAAKKRKKSALYGTVHYELGKLVLTPLSLVEAEGPTHLLLSKENINLSALLGSLKLG